MEVQHDLVFWLVNGNEKLRVSHVFFFSEPNSVYLTLRSRKQLRKVNILKKKKNLALLTAGSHSELLAFY